MLAEGTWTIIDDTPAIILSDGFLKIKKIHPA
jgi:hypothetical protein